MTYHNGSFYQGQWESDKKHGVGKETNGRGNDSYYQGEFKDGSKTGKGISYDNG